MFTKLRQEFRQANLFQTALAVVVVLGLIICLSWAVGSSTAGLSNNEARSISASKSISVVVKQPVNAPYHLLQFSAYSISPKNHTLLRGTSVVLAIIVLFSFFYILRHWFGTYIAALGTILLAGTPIFMVFARSATPVIMLFSTLVPIALFIWAGKTKKYPGLALALLAASVAICLYSPGVIWLLVLVLSLCYRQVESVVKKAGKVWMSVAIGIFVIGVAPLVWASATSIHTTKEILLIPDHWQSISDLGKSTALIPASLIWQARYASDYYIARLPLVNFSVLIFALFGIYAMLNQAKQEATTLLLLLLGGVVLSIINNSVISLVMVLPILIVFAAAGLRYLYIEWQSVFPKNPIPQTLAVFLMILVVGQYFIYGVNYTHYAWPHTERTKRVYVIK